MSSISSFLAETGMFFLASEDGVQAKCRPLGFHMEKYGIHYFGVGDHKDVFRQLRDNPHVEIVAAKPDGTWLRYTGIAIFEEDPIYENLALDYSPELRSVYSEESGHHFRVFHLENAKAVIYSLSGDRDVILDDSDGSDTILRKKAEEALVKGYKKAEEILNNDAEMERLLQRLEKKLKLIPFVGERLSDIAVMVSLLRNYIRKEYTDIPAGSIIAVISALIYFVSPIDIIPDSIPALGFIDDMAVINVCWKLTENDLKEYIKWRRDRDMEIDSQPEEDNTEFAVEE